MNQLEVSLALMPSQHAIYRVAEEIQVMASHKISTINSEREQSVFRCKILDHFLVDNHHLSVVSVEELEKAQETLRFDGIQEPLVAILGWFELAGSRYAVVHGHNAVSLSDLALTQLLTERELQIVTLVASGRSNKQVANHLRISEWTVSAHLRRIFIKLDVDSRAAMVYRCAPMIQC